MLEESNIEKLKQCSNKDCLEFKPLSCFYKDKTRADGYHYLCKNCKDKKVKKRYSIKREELLINNRDKYRNGGGKEQKQLYALKNKEKIRLKNKKWNENNREYLKEYRQKVKERIALRQKEYNVKNRDKINAYARNRRKIDINYKLKKIIRNRIYIALKEQPKISSAVSDLGCTISDLKIYLESKFQPGMSWDNWNFNGWHIDHIIPLSFFNLSDPIQFKKACHYTNLQPLWAKDNQQKSDKLLGK